MLQTHVNNDISNKYCPIHNIHGNVFSSRVSLCQKGGKCSESELHWRCTFIHVS